MYLSIFLLVRELSPVSSGKCLNKNEFTAMDKCHVACSKQYKGKDNIKECT